MPTPESLANKMNAANQRLFVKCGGCGHESSFIREDAWKTWGMHATPHSIRRRAKCVLCGERNLISVSIS